MRFLASATLSLFVVYVAAWLPGESASNVLQKRSHPRHLPHRKVIRSDQGQNLFQRQTNTSSAGNSVGLNKGIRGVNLGSLFVFEPWIDQSEWSKIGCSNAKSEFDCGKQLGQDGVNKAFTQHWSTFYTQQDFQQMVSYGLNSVRIPIGYWVYEDTVDGASETFPQGGLEYLQQVCGWASNAGMYIIIDLHGAPGAQMAQNPDTGQYASAPGFFSQYNYERGLKFLSWMTTSIHTTPEMRNVGALEIVNEPDQGQSSYGDLRQTYYPQAISTIRDAETNAGVAHENQLHIAMMSKGWNGGDPQQYLSNSDQSNLLYDDHRYIKWATSVEQSQDGYLDTSCHDNRDGQNTPLIVGEWSLSPADNVRSNAGFLVNNNKDFYKGWFAAQAKSFESQYGWIFWTWKANLNDPRWSYKDGVAQGIIPENLDQIDSLASSACAGH